MEQQSLAILEDVPRTVYASLSNEQREFINTVTYYIIDGDLETALEMLTLNGSDDGILPPLEQSILQRVVLRLQCPFQPEVYLDEVDLDVRHLTIVGDDMSEQTLRELYIKVFTANYNHFYVEVWRRNLCRILYENQRHNTLEARIDDSSIVSTWFMDLTNEPALILICIGIIFWVISLIDP